MQTKGIFEMGGLFSSPKPAPAPEPIKIEDDSEEEERAKRMALLLRRRRGRGATIVTGYKGLAPNNAAPQQQKTLLGE